MLISDNSETVQATDDRENRILPRQVKFMKKKLKKIKSSLSSMKIKDLFHLTEDIYIAIFYLTIRSD